MTPSLDTFRACLLAGALGDALGYPVEFTRHADIVRRYPVPPSLADFADASGVAQISDDTQMTLFTAEGMIRAHIRGSERGICHPPSIVASALLRWYETQNGHVPPSTDRGWLVDEPRLHAQRAPGNTCMSALRAFAASRALPRVSAPPNDSKGCGAVMRVAPCGLATDSRHDAFALARDTGVITHGHPSGYLSAAYFAAVIWDLARGAPLTDAMQLADPLLAAEPGHEEMSELVAHIRGLVPAGPPSAAVLESVGGGWVGEEALAIALLCALTHDGSVERTLWRAAAHSGDSDSTAAITGNLLGAALGASALPTTWLAVLELRDVIDRIATDLHATFILRTPPPGYPGS